MRHSRRPAHPSRGRESGAAAVEFALIAGFVMIPLLFGIIQYGLFFNDSLSTRQGVREAARQGVVKTFNACGTATTDLDKLRCTTKNEIGTVFGGEPYVSVTYGTWAKGNALTVCALVKEDMVFDFVPVPNNGWISSKTQLSIEQATAPTGTKGADRALPAGVSWPTGCV
jgi:hypothetical protein